MNENLKDKELVLYAPFPSDDTDAEVMDEMEIRCEAEDVDYDNMLGEQDFVEEEASSSLQAEIEFCDDGEEFFEEEEIVVTVDTETDEYEFMPDINLDIYNAE